ncbi:MAG: FG-GAP-like repeat-containing protein [Bacteroidota bacterium]
MRAVNSYGVSDVSDTLYFQVSLTQPTITVSTTSLPDFGSIYVGSNSSPQSFTVSGSNLTSDIAITAPNGFMVSINNSNYVNLIGLNQSGGIVSSKTIYSRFSPTSIGSNSGNSISITSTGATPQSVSVSGTGTSVQQSPTVTTTATTYITQTSAQLNGTVNPNGLSTSYYFHGGCQNGQLVDTRSQDAGSGTSVITVNLLLTGLIPNTTYLYNAAATNSAGTTIGGVLSFTTLQGQNATTIAATNITQTSAQLNGTVNPNGLSTTYYFTYGTTTNYGTNTSVWSAGSGSASVPVNSSINGLSPNTTYHYRIVASNSGGTSYGEDLLFITLSSMSSVLSFSPTSGPIGTSITITGTNFSTTRANDIVYFGAVQAQVSSATETQLVVTVPIGATYQPISVTVNGLTAYSNAAFIVTFPSSQIIDTSSFASKVDFTTGTSPVGIALSDIDGDGRPDLVITNRGSNTVSVFRNTSVSGSITASSFDPKIDFITGSFPWGLEVSDLDGDGKPDLIVANGNDNTISVFRNTSTIGSISTNSFASKVDFATGMWPQNIAIGDVDGDGKPDIIVTNGDDNTISIFRNTSTCGSITANSFAPKVDFATGKWPYGIAIRDLDGDGKPDMIVVNYQSNTVSVFRNTSVLGSITVGSFASAVDFTTGKFPQHVAIFDVDGDSKLDLVITNMDSNSVSVFRNTSTIGSIATNSFDSKVDFTTGTNPRGITICDVDGDKKPDLVVINANDKTLSVFRNISILGSITANSFASKVDFATGNSPVYVAIADMDGDGKPDFVVPNYKDNTVSILRNTIKLTGVERTEKELPTVFLLAQNYPNPFNPTTMFKYALPWQSQVRLILYNVLGQVVRTLADGPQQAGYQETEWNASNNASGIYFYRLDATSISDPTKHFSQTRKMLLIK